MKCKPGDMVILIGHSKPETAQFVGRFFTAVELVMHKGKQLWRIDPPIDESGVRVDKAHDEHLHPIRPPAKPVVVVDELAIEV